MIEPDNDSAFHELIRHRLAAYQPPFDADNWQRMRQKLRRDRWLRMGWLLTGLLMVLGLISYLAILKPTARVSRPLITLKEKEAVKHSPAPVGLRAETIRIGLIRPKSLAVKSKPIARWATSSVIQLMSLASRSSPLLTVNQAYTLPPVIVHSPDEADIIHRVTTGDIGSDSTTYRVLSRNLNQWPNAIIVCDFTSSMYPYSTQLITWLQTNAANRQVKGIVFFTDCDSLGRETEPGQFGQVFATPDANIREVLPLMLASARNTMGNIANAENNIDPLVYAQQHFPKAEHLILIADNSSTVKDMDRVRELHKPVHVILCGPTDDTTRAFQPDYLTMAWETGGSMHTLEDDLMTVTSLRPNTWIQVDRRYYRLNRRGRFVLTGFRHRPTRLLGLFWH